MLQPSLTSPENTTFAITFAVTWASGGTSPFDGMAKAPCLPSVIVRVCG